MPSGGGFLNDTNPDWLVGDTWLWATTPGGIRYAVLLDSYKESWSRDASQIVAQVRVTWADRLAFKTEALGFSAWRNGATYLDRYLPLACPFDPALRCESLEMLGKGFHPNRGKAGTSYADPLSGWFVADWARYAALFKRPPFQIIPDDGRIPFDNRREFTRYCTLRRQTSVKELRTAGLQYETVLIPGVDAQNLAISEPGFVPAATTTYYLTVAQWPAEAMPDARINACLNTVNSVDFPFVLGNSGRTPDSATTFTALPDSLLFRGLALPLEPYPMPNGSQAFDWTAIYEYRPTCSLADGFNDGKPVVGMNPYGWQGFRLQNGTYRRVRVKNSGTSTTDPGVGVYPRTDFRGMYRPGGP